MPVVVASASTSRLESWKRIAGVRSIFSTWFLSSDPLPESAGEFEGQRPSVLCFSSDILLAAMIAEGKTMGTRDRCEEDRSLLRRSSYRYEVIAAMLTKALE